MAATPRASKGTPRKIEYPTGDGKPMAETDIHRDNMMDLIQTLADRYKDDPDVYVSGNLLVYYQEGDRRKRVAPDVFVVFGRPKLPPRDHYLIWEEGRGLDLVIELTSRRTKREDRGKKMRLYRETLRVSEYFLFDPYADWLDPQAQGFRRSGDDLVPIEPVHGVLLPSELLGLNFAREACEFRLYDPATGRKVPTRRERVAEAQAVLRHTEIARRNVEPHLRLAEARAEFAELKLRLAEAEGERLRRELDELRRRLSGGP